MYSLYMFLLSLDVKAVIIFQLLILSLSILVLSKWFFLHLHLEITSKAAEFFCFLIDLTTKHFLGTLCFFWQGYKKFKYHFYFNYNVLIPCLKPLSSYCSALHGQLQYEFHEFFEILHTSIVIFFPIFN